MRAVRRHTRLRLLTTGSSSHLRGIPKAIGVLLTPFNPNFDHFLS